MKHHSSPNDLTILNDSEISESRKGGHLHHSKKKQQPLNKDKGQHQL